jgi:hypothetical protein
MSETGTQNPQIVLINQEDDGHRTLDLIRVADIFRRTSERVFDSNNLAIIFNRKAEMLARALVKAENGQNAEREVKSTLVDIALLAKDNGVHSVILPVDRDRPAGEYLFRHIMQEDKLSDFYKVHLELHSGVYESADDVSALGKVQQDDTVTAFDHNLFEFK